MTMDICQIERLYDLMTQNAFDEVELRLGESDRIKIVKESGNAKTPFLLDETSANPAKDSRDSSDDSSLSSAKTEIRSEIVGVFQFLDDDEKFGAKVGDTVAMGEKLGKIISLNTVKVIKSPVNGRICEIAVKQESIVDYGRLLFVIEDIDEAKA